MTPTSTPHFRLWAALVFILGLLAFGHFSGLAANFSLAQLHAVFSQHWLVAGMAFVALFVAGNLLQIPGVIFLVAAVLALGQLWGGVLTFIAAVVSAGVSFFVIRWIGGDALRQLQYGWVQWLLERMDRYPMRVQIILRLVFQTAPPLNYSLALSGVGFRNYLLGALLGLPLPIAAYIYFVDYFIRKLS